MQQVWSTFRNLSYLPLQEREMELRGAPVYHRVGMVMLTVFYLLYCMYLGVISALLVKNCLCSVSARWN